MDDPLFLWIGRQIQAHPANPYGFSVNWYGYEAPISEVAKNPPLASYYLAFLASAFGWTEAALHIGFLLPAAGAALAVYFLARELCAHPLLAALSAVFTPVFLVSSTTVMADVPLLACWTWAVYFWVRGLRLGSQGSLALAGCFVALAALSKYFGIFLIPLLAVYALAKRRGPGWELAHLLLPAALLGVYQLATKAAYGHGLLLDAFAYATQYESQFGRWSLAKAVVGLTYLGACMSIVLCFAGQLWSMRGWMLGLAIAAAAALAIGLVGSIGHWPLPAGTGPWVALQVGLWMSVGAGVLALAVGDFARRRGAEELLLLVWSVGTAIFAIFGNWSTNGRVLLPVVPAVAILLVRRLEERGVLVTSTGARGVWISLAAGAVLSLAVAAADAGIAGSAREAARDIGAGRAGSHRTIWFEGHWGFQYYMEAQGAHALVVNRSSLSVGDALILPRNNTNVFWPAPPWARHVETRTYRSPRWLSTMSPALGAGFYTDYWGPLPFAFGPAPPESYEVFEVAGQAAPGR